MNASPSYGRGHRCCSDDCLYLDWEENEPCWGKIVVVDEILAGENDYMWIHECEGHYGSYYDGAKYKPEPSPVTSDSV